MNVAQLIKWLKDYPEDMRIVLSKDEEGNGFHFLAGLGVEPYDDSYGLELLDIDDLKSNLAEDDEEFVDNYPRALVLWP